MPNELNTMLIDQYQRSLGEVGEAVVIDYSGLNSEKMAEFRSELRKANLTMEVVKNRLAVQALKERGLKALMESDKAPEIFKGPTALIFGAEGAIDAAKFTVKWLRGNDKTITLKGGQMGPDVLSADAVQQVSTLPGRKELLGKMAGGFLAMPQKVAATFQAGYLQVLWAFKALEEKLEKQG